MHTRTCLFLACQRWQPLHWMTGWLGCTSLDRLTWPLRQSAQRLEALASKGMPLPCCVSGGSVDCQKGQMTTKDEGCMHRVRVRTHKTQRTHQSGQRMMADVRVMGTNAAPLAEAACPSCSWSWPSSDEAAAAAVAVASSAMLAMTTPVIRSIEDRLGVGAGENRQGFGGWGMQQSVFARLLRAAGIFSDTHAPTHLHIANAALGPSFPSNLVHPGARAKSCSRSQSSQLIEFPGSCPDGLDRISRKRRRPRHTSRTHGFYERSLCYHDHQTRRSFLFTSSFSFVCGSR